MFRLLLLSVCVLSLTGFCGFYGVAIANAAAAAAMPGQCSGVNANPWVYNFMIDGYPAKVINDAEGEFPLDLALFLQPELVARAQRKRFLNETAVKVHNNMLYIKREDGGVLVDTGSGPNEEDGLYAGTLFEQLDAEGISRDSIKSILLTHADLDHLGGLVEDFVSFKPAFPKATVYLSKAEYDYWMSDPIDFAGRRFTEEQKEFFAMVGRAVLDAVKDHLKTFEFDENIIDGVTAIPTPYHTPGSAAYLFKDGKSALLFAGDATTVKAQSIENPHFSLFSDFDQKAAPAGRYALLDRVVAERWQLLSGHTLFPGLMYVNDLGLGFQTTSAAWMGSSDVMSVCGA